MSAALRQSELTIRTCILYEVLDKKPIKQSFDNFRRKVGNDVISYYEFEFWFYRFNNGNHDLHYDRSVNPVPRLLSGMPLNVINEVLNHLDLIDLIALMKVSRNFRRAVQNMKVCVIESLVVQLFEETDCTKIIYNLRYKFEYRQNDAGCEVTFFARNGDIFEKQKVVAGGNYIELCNKDLKLMVESGKAQMELFRLDNKGIQKKSRKKFIAGIEKALNSAKNLSSKTVQTQFVSYPELAQLLPIFPAEKLKKLILNGLDGREYEQLIDLDQWKKARIFQGFEGELNVPIEHFLHFEWLDVHLATFTDEDAMKLRDMIDRSAHFVYAEIQYTRMNIDRLKRVFDVHSVEHNHIYETPDKRSFYVAFGQFMIQITKPGYQFDYNYKL
ncbi:F-box domain-containing protein [Caenorhabditis elegans]|uniref:F-box domain-containing protein n=1 Tax=Caenorhabditis elegans TaxID=6239 RepID=O17196_CAEEL|nr:F-box domain-containing protein [Caenorhabditis elegans]CCD63670.1 F-box domain-containing protein [Caenorhabditis elegans]|eukprot:NP_494010.1 F-box A protein [Caenorhabditis elegans]